MAINYAEKYSPVVDELFSRGSITQIAFNTDYDWAGVKTVNVYSIPTVPLEDYTRSGMQRFGTPSELQDNVQEMTLTQDKSFTFTIDRGNNMDQMGVKGAAQALAREIRDVVTPHVDTYRLATVASKATAANTSTAALDQTDAYEAFLDGQAAMGDNLVPEGGRIAYVSYDYYKKIKLDPSFIKQGDMAQQLTITGAVGVVDGVPIIPAPASRLPANTNFLLVHPVSSVAPMKLVEYRIHVDPPGISGTLVEGRLYFDAFVLDNKVNAIYWSKSA